MVEIMQILSISTLVFFSNGWRQMETQFTVSVCLLYYVGNVISWIKWIACQGEGSRVAVMCVFLQKQWLKCSHRERCLGVNEMALKSFANAISFEEFMFFHFKMT